MKANEKTREERLAKMRSLHDQIKVHPYWMTFDINLLEDVRKNFRELSCCVWNSADDKNPYYVILRCVTHDFNCMLSNIPYWVKEGKFDERKSDTIMVLQTYLMNIHRLIDGMEPDGNIVGYTYLGHGVKKFKAEWDEEKGKYFAVNIIKQKNVSAVRKWCEKYANLSSPSHTRDYARQCLEELDRGEMLIGKFWRIVE